MPGPASYNGLGNIINSFVVQIAIPAGGTIAANSTVERTYTLLGLRVGDVITANKPTAFTSGLGLAMARCSAADTLALSFINSTAGALSIQSENWLIQVDRPGYDAVSQIPTAIA